MRSVSTKTVGLLVLVTSATFAAHVNVQESPSQFVLRSAKETSIAIGVTAVNPLRGVTKNGLRVAEWLPTGSSLVTKPDGSALFSYSDMFLRNFRGAHTTQLFCTYGFNHRPELFGQIVFSR